MTYLPILLLTVGLLGVVMLMAGGKEKGLQAVRNIGLVVVAMIIMASLFALVTSRQL